MTHVSVIQHTCRRHAPPRVCTITTALLPQHAHSKGEGKLTRTGAVGEMHLEGAGVEPGVGGWREDKRPKRALGRLLSIDQDYQDE